MKFGKRMIRNRDSHNAGLKGPHLLTVERLNSNLFFDRRLFCEMSGRAEPRQQPGYACEGKHLTWGLSALNTSTLDLAQPNLGPY